MGSGMTQDELKNMREYSEECLSGHGIEAFCESYDCRSVLKLLDHIAAQDEEIDELRNDRIPILKVSVGAYEETIAENAEDIGIQKALAVALQKRIAELEAENKRLRDEYETSALSEMFRVQEQTE